MDFNIKTWLFSFTLLFVSTATYGGLLTGEGYGKTQSEAKHNALADLAMTIHAEVSSEVESLTSVTEKRRGHDDVIKTAKNVLKIHSSLPILGAHFEISKHGREMHAYAQLDSKRASALYEQKLKELTRDGKNLQDLISKTTNSNHLYDYYSESLTLTTQFDKYKTVAFALGGTTNWPAPFNKIATKNQLNRLQEKVSSLELAAKLITAGIKQTKIYLTPPLLRHSHEVTPFASVMKDKLAEHIHTVRSPKLADYIMEGHYEINAQGIVLTYYLSNTASENISTKTVQLTEKSYKNYQTQPQRTNFDRLLHDGIILSKDFRAELSTNLGRNSLLFDTGETIELLVKLNHPGYFYLVGHINKTEEQYSYLVDLQDDRGNRKFVYRVSADDVNRWISLGEFDVSPPYGVESMQMIASSHDLVDRVPRSSYDPNDELFKLSSNPSETVAQTRALKRKSDKKIKIAEAVLLFTTREG